MSLLTTKKQATPTYQIVLPNRQEMEHVKNLAVGVVATVVVVRIGFMAVNKIKDIRQKNAIKKLKMCVEDLETRVKVLESEK